MAYDFDVVGWEDFDGSRYEGKPSDPEAVGGAFVNVYDPDTGESHHFWVYVYTPYEDWEEWLDHIGIICEMHGFALA